MKLGAIGLNPARLGEKEHKKILKGLMRRGNLIGQQKTE